MAKSTYYFEINKKDAVAEKNAELSDIIREIFDHNKGKYGVRRVYAELRNKDIKVNHKRVQRLMHVMELRGKTPKEKYHSYQGEVGQTADNVINRDFSTTAPLQKWATDVSQFSFSWGKCYLSPIIDMHTNEIISYDLSVHPDLIQIKNMLSKAFEQYPHTEKLIMHSDQGWQYRHEYYREMLNSQNIVQSMSRKGNCYDNSIMESFFGRMKNEMFYGNEKEYQSFEIFSKAVADYIDYYNNERIQSKTKWMSPVQYRRASMNQTK